MHAPSACRDILRRLKSGQDDPRSLLAEAKALPDPAWAARALFGVSGDRRLQWQEGKQGLRDALRSARKVERLGQRAELLGELIGGIDAWREGARNPQAPGERADFVDALVKDIEHMPDGQWTHDAIIAVAKQLDTTGRQRLMGRALSNPGFEAASAKALMRAGPDEGLEILLEAAPADVRAMALSADDALDAAWSIEDESKRAEALRVLIWKEEDPERLGHMAASAAGRLPAEAVRVHTQVAARLDKLGLDPSALLASAEAMLERVPADKQPKLRRKLNEAQARAAGREATPQARAPAPPVAVSESTGSTLALVNTYEGGLKPPHLRAVARAAPLCVAFSLDLALIDFPADLATIVQAAETETGIGEGGRYLVALQAAGRLRDVVTGTVVATTPKPDAEKAWVGGGNVTMLMGVGPRGLPRSMLDEAAHHYEITGQGISLETATAMGILAERLRYAASGAK